MDKIYLMIRLTGTLDRVDEDMTELTEALECSACGGHMKLDFTFIDQVDTRVNCPYCKTLVDYNDKEDEGEMDNE